MNVQDILNGFRSTIEEMALVHKEKIEEYGISRYQDANRHTSEASVMLFSDIHRKYIRLRQQLLYRLLGGVEPDWDSVRRGCVDLANYGVMGVQVAEIIQNKGQPPHHWAGSGPAEAPVKSIPIPATFPIEQIAFVGRTGTLDSLKMLGATEWSHDDVVTRARVFGSEPIEQKAHLVFNYQLIPGKELEVIQYSKGDNFLSDSGILGGLSHMGLHVSDIDDATALLEDRIKERLPVAQDAVTLRHTNPAIKDTRRYRYRIFDTRNTLGFFLKLIQRRIIDPGVQGVSWHRYKEDAWMYVSREDMFQ